MILMKRCLGIECLIVITSSLKAFERVNSAIP